MLFFSWSFIFLFAICFVTYWGMDSHRLRKYWLLFISYVFYGYWDVRFLALLIVSSYSDYLLAMAIEKTTRQRSRYRLAVASVFVNLGTLLLFKYFNFFTESFSFLANSMGFHVNALTLNIVVPVGISFYTIHAMSYVLDVYNRKIPACRSKLDFMLYVAFFPQLLAGPIVRAKDFLFQMPEKKYFRDVPWRGCVLLFLMGLIKKTCIGDNIGEFVDPIFADPQYYTGATLWMAAVLFGIQVYVDFSGYAEMATATARLLGYKIPLNFYWPYLSLNPADFSRRWHITLANLLREYIFLPMGGVMANKLLTFRNLMVTMAISGLWHGAAFHFMVWGMWIGLCIFVYYAYDRIFGRQVRRFIKRRVHAWPLKKLIALACMAMSMMATGLSGMFFRERDMERATDIFLQCIGLRAGGHESLLGLGLVIIGLFLAAHKFTFMYRPAHKAERWHPLVFAAVVGAGLAVYTLCRAIETTPFIYFEY